MTEEGSASSAHYDPEQRHAAARIQNRNPRWLVLWGVSSRRYWAFPMFDVAPGTIISAVDPKELLTLMTRAEATTRPGRRA